MGKELLMLTSNKVSFANGLIARFDGGHKKNFVIEVDETVATQRNFVFDFSEQELRSLFKFLWEGGRMLFDGFKPKAENKYNTDYRRYYDHTYDGTVEMTFNEFQLAITLPTKPQNQLYKFSQKRLQALVYEIDEMFNMRALQNLLGRKSA